VKLSADFFTHTQHSYNNKQDDLSIHNILQINLKEPKEGVDKQNINYKKGCTIQNITPIRLTNKIIA